MPRQVPEEVDQESGMIAQKSEPSIGMLVRFLMACYTMIDQMPEPSAQNLPFG
jgi:hypothetical protein